MEGSNADRERHRQGPRRSAAAPHLQPPTDPNQKHLSARRGRQSVEAPGQSPLAPASRHRTLRLTPPIPAQRKLHPCCCRPRPPSRFQPRPKALRRPDCQSRSPSPSSSLPHVVPPSASAPGARVPYCSVLAGTFSHTLAALSPRRQAITRTRPPERMDSTDRIAPQPRRAPTLTEQGPTTSPPRLVPNPPADPWCPVVPQMLDRGHWFKKRR